MEDCHHTTAYELEMIFIHNTCLISLFASIMLVNEIENVNLLTCLVSYVLWA